jgi:hypothetical protein
LGRKQEQAIAALLEKPTLGEAATAAGVDEKTLRRWLALPDFLAAYRQARAQVVEASIARLQQASGQAVDALTQCLSADRACDRIRAAVAILEHAHRGVELMDLAGQVAELKRQIEELRSGNGNAAAGSEPPPAETEGQQGGAEPPARPDQAGPGDAPAGGGDDARPLAGTAAPLWP